MVSEAITPRFSNPFLGGGNQIGPRRAAKIVFIRQPQGKRLCLEIGRDMLSVNLSTGCFKGTAPVFFKYYLYHFAASKTFHTARRSRKDLLLPRVETDHLKEPQF